MKISRKQLALMITLVAAIVAVVGADVFLRWRHGSTAGAPSMTIPEQYGFQIACPAGTRGYGNGQHYTCSEGPEGMWEADVEITATTAKDVLKIVQDNNQTLALTDSAYMQVVREDKVDGEPALIVKQTGGSEAGPSSDDLAKTLLVIHAGRLYAVHARSLLPDADVLFASFHFTSN